MKNKKNLEKIKKNKSYSYKYIQISAITLFIFLILFFFYNSINRNYYTGYLGFDGSFFDKFINLASLGRLSINISSNIFRINITNPENKTYNFSSILLSHRFECYCK